MTLYDPGHPSSLNNQGIKLNGVGLYLNPGTEVLVSVTGLGSRNFSHNEKVSVPVTSFKRATKLIFDHPVELIRNRIDCRIAYNISLSVKVTGKGSAKTTKDEEKTERTVRVKTSMCKTEPIKITIGENNIIGELYFTSPSN